MKNLKFIVLIFLLAAAACQPAPEPVNIEAEEASVNALLDNFYNNLEAGDVSALLSMLNDDMVSVGSDPSEKWDKAQIAEIWSQMFKDQPFEISMFGDRLVKVAKDGKSAIVMNQYFVPAYSTKLPFRSVFHLVKADDQWSILFSNIAIVPKNEDIPKLNAALAAE